MHAINTAIGAVLDALLWPFRARPLTGLIVVSLAAAVILLAVFKLTSNQTALAAAKRRLQAHLFELRLFQDDPRLIARVVRDLLWQQAIYLRYALVPLLWVALPLTMLAAHLQMRYGYDGLRPGHAALVTVRLKADAAPVAASGRPPALTLEAPPGLQVETPGVWAAPLRETAWRVSATRDGDYELRVSGGGAEAVTKHVRVTTLIVPRSPVRPEASVWNQLAAPAEAPLPADSPIEAIEVTYPERWFGVLGVSLHWIAIFLLSSLVFAWLCRSVFKVVI